VIAYRAMRDVPRELAQYLSRLLHAERRRRGARENSRALTCFRQAVLGLRWFRQGVEVTALARDHGISRATGYRYLDEVIDVLADQAPDLHEALEKAKADGLAYVILDGKIFSADRCNEKTISVKGKQIDLWYSGKAHKHGGNIQAIMEPDGFPRWVADIEPGSNHDLTVARKHVLGALYWAASHLDLPTLSDGGYDGAGIGGTNSLPATRSSTWTTAPTTPSCADCAAGRTRLRHPHRPLAHPPPHHRQPQQDRRHRQSHARTHPFRTRPTHLKVGEITSVPRQHPHQHKHGHSATQPIMRW
jgi:hypothetical protein